MNKSDVKDSSQIDKFCLAIEVSKTPKKIVKGQLRVTLCQTRSKVITCHHTNYSLCYLIILCRQTPQTSAIPECTGDGYLVRSCKILSESYKRMHCLTRFSDRFLQDKHSFYKILTR